MTNPSLPRVRTLVVDDSAFARKVVREILQENPWVDVVGTARDGQEALELAASLQPDLVVSDLHMPRLNGVQFIRAQMQRRPVPILVLSAAAQDAVEVIEALAAGAIDVVRKPTALATESLREVSAELVEKIQTGLRLPLVAAAVSESNKLAAPPRPAPQTHHAVDVVVLGISTGGPQALRYLVPQLPANLPVPLAIVLHMPLGYTAMYAEKLNELSALEVKEAAEGDVLRPGLVLIAAAGRHLTFERMPTGEVVARLPSQPLTKIHRPSADVLFRSAAEVYGKRVLAVVMTGMGDDGKEGAAWVKAMGGVVITEAEKSCVIYGMPRSVTEAGLSDFEVPLDEMASAILTRL